LPQEQNVYIRAHGYYQTGRGNGSLSILESVRNVYLSQTDIFLPLITHNYAACFPGASEQEPNNSPAQANGPLCLGQNYAGKPDFDKQSDWFYFEVGSSGTVTVRITNFDPVAQVQLYATPVGEGSLLASHNNQQSGIYQIVRNLTPGRYYVRLVSVTTPVGTQNYTIRVTFP
jgi:hypothetical protein